MKTKEKGLDLSLSASWPPQLKIETPECAAITRTLPVHRYLEISWPQVLRRVSDTIKSRVMHKPLFIEGTKDLRTAATIRIGGMGEVGVWAVRGERM